MVVIHRKRFAQLYFTAPSLSVVHLQHLQSLLVSWSDFPPVCHSIYYYLSLLRLLSVSLCLYVSVCLFLCMSVCLYIYLVWRISSDKSRRLNVVPRGLAKVCQPRQGVAGINLVFHCCLSQCLINYLYSKPRRLEQGTSESRNSRVRANRCLESGRGQGRLSLCLQFTKSAAN